MLTGGPLKILVSALAERGRFAEAHTLLSARGVDGDLGAHPSEIGILYARARLALAEGEFERARELGTRAGDLRDTQGRPNPTWMPWRSTVALALAHVGRLDEAAALADVELRLAERFGAPFAIVVALHARIVAEPVPERRIALCQRALAVDPLPRLELARIRLELGSTLRRRGDRVAAREPLQRALADADAGGAVLLSERAHRELVATGLRPRRAQLEGTDALTPRQRQICEIAATGATNRMIAQQLFLSARTVEAHLAAAYLKLGVASREDLAAALTH
jgi:DNA-binding CsgD family transcriptional regulator